MILEHIRIEGGGVLAATIRAFLPLLLCAAGLSAQFRDVAKKNDIDFKLVSGSASKPYILESMAGGVGFLDFDNDGWIDIYLVNGSTLAAEKDGSNEASDRLFRNTGNGTFADVTARSKLGDTSWGMGVAAADVNNDGFEDLYITNYGPNRLYLNRGDGTFRDFSAWSGAAGSAWSSSAAFADYDQDGDLDLYVTNYLEFNPDELPEDSQLCRYRGIRVQCGPRGMIPTADRFYENRGDGRFRDATANSEIGDAPDSYGLGVIWADYDNDGDQDIYVANDSTPNFLFKNNGDKTFTEMALLAGVALSDDGKEQAGMGADFGDYDNDGDLDLVVTNFSDDYNTLYRNEGDGRFQDVSYRAGLAEATWTHLSWGVRFADVDLDGALDIVIANGHVYPEVDEQDLGTRYRQSNSVFLNQRDGTFKRDASSEFFFPGPELSSRGLAAGDINNDGQVEFLIANLDAAPSLMAGDVETKGNWLLLKLEGTESNRGAVGARVTVTAGDLVQIREVRRGGSYQSQSDPRLHFGLGGAETIDKVEIRWPAGARQLLGSVKVNQVLTIKEPGSGDDRQ
jgi:hypothetical protein